MDVLLGVHGAVGSWVVRYACRRASVRREGLSKSHDLKKKKRQETSLVSSQCLLIRWRPHEAPAVNHTILKHSARRKSAGTRQYLETGSRQRG